mgnify:CR=1 FL=1
MADEAIKNGVLDILADLTGSDDVKKNLDLNLFETGLPVSYTHLRAHET